MGARPFLQLLCSSKASLRPADRGAGPSGNPDRGTGAAALAPTQEEEDLRRHLDRFPYLDLRHAVEMPDTWTSSF